MTTRQYEDRYYLRQIITHPITFIFLRVGLPILPLNIADVNGYCKRSGRAIGSSPTSPPLPVLSHSPPPLIRAFVPRHSSSVSFVDGPASLPLLLSGFNFLSLSVVRRIVASLIHSPLIPYPLFLIPCSSLRLADSHLPTFLVHLC
jgi:hypothetical protein